MRLSSIELEWFRGAAEPVSLNLNGKSVAVYGANGAGKSSFVDAVEYFLCSGKIGHLSHEYSGKKQEKGVINTHKPTLSPTKATIGFMDKSSATVDVKLNGAFGKTGDGLIHINGLDYRRVVLRQDEVAAFIGSPKGSKYSALLPLLGLEQLECAAENVRQLTKRVSKVLEIENKQYELSVKAKEADGHFSSIADLDDAISAFHSKYRSEMPREGNLLADVQALNAAIRVRVAALTPDVHRYDTLRSLAVVPLEDALNDVEAVEVDLVSSALRLIPELVAVLDNAALLVEAESGKELRCPACGSDIERDAFRSHVAAERERVASETKVLQTFTAAAERLAFNVGSAKTAATAELAANWWVSANEGGDKDIAWLRGLNPRDLIPAGAQATRKSIRSRILPIIQAASSETANPPPGTEELLADSGMVRAAEAVLMTLRLEAEVAKHSTIINHLQAVEAKLRSDIRDKADAVIADISKDIQRMWAILHPNHEIENVRLHHPNETEKAIDIELKFFGVEQKSPRLTLSEGNRNSLGLCVFLAMALRAAPDVPVILDDVVVSLDRDHRGMIVGLLQLEFANRQIAIFTHDRDWFAELRRMLEGPDWNFHTLKPFVSPAEGITWSTRVSNLDDARAHLDSAPDTAANIARKLMDVELGLLCEKLRLRMEYRHGLRNDHRMAHDFLPEMVAACKQALQRKGDDGKYKIDTEAPAVLETTDRLLMTWGNRGSHTFDVVKAEATQLIEHCEKALDCFQCGKCDKAITKFDDDKGTKQCECGAIRWRYDKL